MIQLPLTLHGWVCRQLACPAFDFNTKENVEIFWYNYCFLFTAILAELNKSKTQQVRAELSLLEYNVILSLGRQKKLNIRVHGYHLQYCYIWEQRTLHWNKYLITYIYTEHLILLTSFDIESFVYPGALCCRKWRNTYLWKIYGSF